MIIELRAPRQPAVWVAFGYLGLVAWPLSVWASPVDNSRASWIFAASLVIFGVTAGVGTSRHAVGWARGYFALGCALALGHGEFRPNELAGVMLLFAPLAGVLASAPAGSLRRWHRTQAVLLTLLFAGLLVSTGSRGSILAVWATAVVVICLQGRWRVGISGLMACLLGVSTSRRWLDWLIYDGQSQGFSLDVMLTGRPEIWHRSLLALADFPLVGIGVGSFPQVVPQLYATGACNRWEDAHSLPLQTALDLGPPGLWAVVVLIAAGFLRVLRAFRRSPAGSARRVWALGLFASLFAFMLFNLADAIAFGTLGGLAFWGLLGLVLALPSPGRSRPEARRVAILGALVVLGPILLFYVVQGSRLDLQRASRQGARAVLVEPGALADAHRTLDRVSQRRCRANWLEGRVAAALGAGDRRDAAWRDLAACEPSFTELMAAAAPNHRELAERAVARQPTTAAALFWLARIEARAAAPAAATRLYRRGLRLEPRDGLAWLELGRLLHAQNSWAALAAYAQACEHGDPGANACGAAGHLAGQLGDPSAAAAYYRASNWQGFRERAGR